MGLEVQGGLFIHGLIAGSEPLVGDAKLPRCKLLPTSAHGLSGPQNIFRCNRKVLQVTGWSKDQESTQTCRFSYL